MFRVEDKFGCNLLEMYMLQSRIGTILQSDSNEKDEEGYTVTSVYFDDLYDSHLQDTIDGNSIRNKYRIRIYNNSFKIIKLEVKTKKNSRISKKSQNITFSEMKMLLNGETIEGEYLLEDPITLFNIAIKERGLHPVAIVAYERKAFVYEAGNVRITFDRNVRFSDDVECFGERIPIFDSVDKPDCVLEVKYDEFIPEFITQTLELGNMQQTAYSKYRLSRIK